MKKSATSKKSAMPKMPSCGSKGKGMSMMMSKAKGGTKMHTRPQGK